MRVIKKKLKNQYGQRCYVGFTLIEVMAALAIIAVMATTIFGVQMTMMRSTARSTGIFERLWHMTTFLREAGMKSTIPESESFEKRAKIASPSLELVYSARRPSKNSKLTTYNDIYIERVESNWVGEQNKKNSDALITFLYRPKVKKEKAEQAQEVASLSDKVNTKSEEGKVNTGSPKQI